MGRWHPTPHKRSVRAALRDHRRSRPASPGQHVGQPLSSVPRRRARHLWRWLWKHSSNASPGSMCTRARWSPASSDEAGALSSIISIGDVVKHRLGELGEEAGAMREYISGSR